MDHSPEQCIVVVSTSAARSLLDKKLWPFRAKRGMAWQFGAAPQTAAGAYNFLYSVSTIFCRCWRYKRLRVVRDRARKTWPLRGS
jgi:hypothetical protein